MRTGNMSPKERVLLWVHNTVHKDKTGKEILTPAERHAIVEGWKPDNNEQVQEYNRYNNGWILEGGARLDAQTAYLNSMMAILQAGRLVDYAMWTECSDTGEGFLERLRTMDLGVDEEDALDLVLRNCGLEFNHVVHRCAFLNLSDAVQKDLLTLDPDAKTERQYLEHEEILATLFNGKKHLTLEAKEQLADLIIESLRNKYADIFAKKEMKPAEWFFRGYFAELPALEVAKKCAKDNGIQYQDDENLEDTLLERIRSHAAKHTTTVRDMLRASILRWLNEGLFTEEYSPIWNSGIKATRNDADTKLPHKDIFEAWLKAKVEATTTLQTLINENKLKVENREKNFFGYKEPMRIITGESLQTLEGDYLFADDFRKQANDLVPLALLVLHLRERDLTEEYATLLAFADIYKKLSRVYEIELGYKVAAHLAEVKKRLESMNTELQYIEDKLTLAMYRHREITFLVEVFMDDLLINIDEVEPGTGETETHYAAEFKKLLGNEF